MQLALGIFIGSDFLTAGIIVNNTYTEDLYFDGTPQYDINTALKPFLGVKPSQKSRRDAAKYAQIGLQISDGRFLINGQTVELVLAQSLMKIKQIAENKFGAVVEHAVVAVPCTFTEQQRRSVLDAARIAQLTVLQLINEPAAAGMGVSGSGKFGVLMVDNNSLQLALMKLEQKNMKVVSVSGYQFDQFDQIRALQFIQKEMKAQQFSLSSFYFIGNSSSLQLKQTLVPVNETAISRGATLQAGMLLKYKSRQQESKTTSANNGLIETQPRKKEREPRTIITNGQKKQAVPETENIEETGASQLVLSDRQEREEQMSVKDKFLMQKRMKKLEAELARKAAQREAEYDAEEQETEMH